MLQLGNKYEVIETLRREILPLQGFHKPLANEQVSAGLGEIEHAFPHHRLPTGAIHEFISIQPIDAAATSGFLTGLAGMLSGSTGTCLWISTKRIAFAAGLKHFGIHPDRIIFVDLPKPKEALWAIEEALKCEALSIVVGEINELSFTESRRLQLAVEKSAVTGFIHRQNPKAENTVASIAKWKITSLPSTTENHLPGLGVPKWNVQLVKVRNGHPGTWQLEWLNGSFRNLSQPARAIPFTPKRKVG